MQQSAEQLKQEIIGKLSTLREENGDAPIHAVYATRSLYRGLYLDAAPDFVVGYNPGYRCSWDGAVGKVATLTLEDNQKAWSGDHCVDPAFVPGVLFSNRKVEATNPGIEALAPTALALFGLQPPGWMEGKPLL
jgi:predicted AlkP superfamily phosphohydrolase/phosphomutase